MVVLPPLFISLFLFLTVTGTIRLKKKKITKRETHKHHHRSRHLLTAASNKHKELARTRPSHRWEREREEIAQKEEKRGWRPSTREEKRGTRVSLLLFSIWAFDPDPLLLSPFISFSFFFFFVLVCFYL